MSGLSVEGPKSWAGSLCVQEGPKENLVHCTRLRFSLGLNEVQVDQTKELRADSVRESMR